MSQLAAVGRVNNPCPTSYNGVSLNVGTQSRVVITPVPDTSGRTHTSQRLHFTFETFVVGTANGTTDSQMSELRKKLCVNGKRLEFDGRGAGIPVVIDHTTDLSFGPRVQEIGIEFLGGDKAAKLTWTLETEISCCTTVGPFLEFNFTVEHLVDKNGMTTRTLAGHFRIPNNRSGPDSRIPADSPDLYRQSVNPPLLPGFSREYGPFQLSEDRQSLTWSVIDREQGDSFPPEYVVDSPMVRTVLSSQHAGLAVWAGSISARYTTVKAAPDLLGPLKHFLNVVVRQQVENLQEDFKRVPAGREEGGAGAIRPVAFSMENPNVYGRTRDHSFTFSFAFASSLARTLRAGNLWKPVPGTGWKKWAQSLSQSAHHPYGGAKLVFRPGDDRIIDGCDGAADGVETSATGVNNPAPRPSFMDAVLRAMKIVFGDPDPDLSYLFFENVIEIQPLTANVLVRTLPKAPVTADMVSDSLAGVLGKGFDPLAITTKLPSDLGTAGGHTIQNDTITDRAGVQRRLTPIFRIVMVGRAVRVGFPVPCPILEDVDGSTPELDVRKDAGEGFRCWLASGGLVPVYHATWRLPYWLTGDPVTRPLPVAPNPLYGRPRR